MAEQRRNQDNILPGSLPPASAVFDMTEDGGQKTWSNSPQFSLNYN